MGPRAGELHEAPVGRALAGGADLLPPRALGQYLAISGRFSPIRRDLRRLGGDADEPARRPPAGAGRPVIRFRPGTPGTAAQAFESTGYRYALLDKDGVQGGRELADRALVHPGTAGHTADLPRGKRAVPDYSDRMTHLPSLRPGEEYFLVVPVRNLTGLARFKAP